VKTKNLLNMDSVIVNCKTFWLPLVL